jgi:hypothetical protein
LILCKFGGNKENEREKMFKYAVAVLLIVHGLIHFLGVAKAYNYVIVNQLTIPISRPLGFWWLLAACCFLVAGSLVIAKNDYWPFIAIIAVVISEMVIVYSWHDARLGTIPNILILAVAFLNLGSFRFEAQYRTDVKQSLQPGKGKAIEMFTEKDLQPLPEPVQRYLRFVGVLDRPKVKNMRVVIKGQMREKGGDYFPFTSEQYNFFDEPTRLLFMKSTLRSVTVPAYHKCINGMASRDMRFFGLFPFIQIRGAAMNQSEMVALFNDMCLLAPATLVDKRIKWQPVEGNTVTATFTNHGIGISATLYFNSQGQLVDFVSDDRSAIPDMKPYRFSTPVSSYKTMNDCNLFYKREAVWDYPEGKFTDGTFTLSGLSYNVTA